MDYRKLPRGNEELSCLGIGTASFTASNAKEIENIINLAIEYGINIMDTSMPFGAALPYIGKALKGKRDKMHIQMHLGAHYPNGIYSKTLDIKTIQKEFSRQLKLFYTDYGDFGFFHCVDSCREVDRILNDGIFDWALKMKNEGRIKHIGFSSHTADVCRKFIETGEIDLFMFSINAGYDLSKSGSSLIMSEERKKLYQLCREKMVGISIMKPFHGGRLLNSRTSPFEKSMSIPQCLHYALNTPAAITCLPGVCSIEEFKSLLDYYSAMVKSKNDLNFNTEGFQVAEGNCVYCNHCAPCPAGINIGSLNKYMDLYLAGDKLAKKHYMNLSAHASDCTECGQCNKRCPFSVNSMERIKKAAELFGR